MKYKFLLITLLIMPLLSFATGLELYQFPTATQKQRFVKLSYELRCLVCQNQNLAESNAPLAGDLRKEIANKIKAGQSDKTIIQYLVKRYGDFILYKPPVMKTTWILWFGPFVLLIGGLIILLSIIAFLKKHQVSEITTTDQAQIKKILANNE